MVNSDEFKDPSPCQIVQRLADRGVYVASESTQYRLLREVGQLLQSICERQGITPNQLTVHSDNGSPMKGRTMHRHDATPGCGCIAQPTGGQ